MADIVFCTNEKYAQYIPTLLESIIHNTSETCRFFIVFSSINEKDKRNITKTIESSSDKHNVYFVFFDSNAQLKEISATELKPFRGSFDAYSRLFLPALLKEYNVTACIYMDIDTVVLKPLDDLIAISQKIKAIGGVLDTVSIDLKLTFANDHYINSGMLLMNLPKLRDIDFTSRCLNFMAEHAEILQCPDQDAISNALKKTEIELVEQRFNEYLPSRRNVLNAVILHFTGPQKPWMSSTRWRYKKLCWYHYYLMNLFKLKGYSNYKKLSDVIFVIMSRLRFFLNLWLSIRKTLGLLKD